MDRPHFDSFEWQPQYDCHIGRIDHHRRKMVESFNFMIERYNARLCKDNIAQPFFKLGFNAESFFLDVEVLIKQLAYPKYHDVRQRHKNVMRRIVQFKEDFSEGKQTVCIDMLFFLTEWIRTEILTYDPELVAFLNEKGVK